MNGDTVPRTHLFCHDHDVVRFHARPGPTIDTDSDITNVSVSSNGMIVSILPVEIFFGGRAIVVIIVGGRGDAAGPCTSFA